MPMSAKVDQRLAELFAEAEADRTCVVCPWTSANRKAILYRIGDGIVSPTRGAFARAEYWDNLDRTEKALHIARSLSRQHPSWVFCGPTAAAAHGLETPRTLLKHPCIASTRSADPSSAIRRLCTDTSDVRMIQGIPVVDALTAAIDCLRIGTFPEALAVADSALRILPISQPRFEQEAITRLRGKHRAREGRKAVRYANGLSENGGESYARGVMIEEGFCVPRLQAEIPDPLEPGKTYRVDYLWTASDGTPIIGELDGKDKLEDPRMLKGLSPMEAVRQERTRESRLSITGARIIRFTFGDVLNRRRFVSTLRAFGVPMA